MIIISIAAVIISIATQKVVGCICRLFTQKTACYDCTSQTSNTKCCSYSSVEATNCRDAKKCILQKKSMKTTRQTI